MLRSPRPATVASALAVGAFALTMAACSDKPTPEKTETITFGCYIGECVPADDDGGESADAADASDAATSD